MKNKKINNSIKLGIILLAVVLITIIVCNIYKNYRRNQINNSYISKYVSSIKYQDLKSAIVEFSSNTMLYISYTGNENVYDFESDIKPLITKYELTNSFVYVNVTDKMHKDGFLNNLNNVLSLKDNTIKKLPAIIYYKDNIAVDYIDSSNHTLNKGDFAQLLDKHEISNND